MNRSPVFVAAVGLVALTTALTVVLPALASPATAATSSTTIAAPAAPVVEWIDDASDMERGGDPFDDHWTYYTASDRLPFDFDLFARVSSSSISLVTDPSHPRLVMSRGFGFGLRGDDAKDLLDNATSIASGNAHFEIRVSDGAREIVFDSSGGFNARTTVWATAMGNISNSALVDFLDARGYAIVAYTIVVNGGASVSNVTIGGMTTYFGTEPTPTLSSAASVPTTDAVTTGIDIQGSGYAPGEDVEISLSTPNSSLLRSLSASSAAVRSATSSAASLTPAILTAAEAGTVSGKVVLPASTAPGTYVITANGHSSLHSATVTIILAAAAPIPTPSPATPSDTSNESSSTPSSEQSTRNGHAGPASPARAPASFAG